VQSLSQGCLGFNEGHATKQALLMNYLNVQMYVLWRVSQVIYDVSIILYRPIWKMTSRVRVSFLEEASCHLRLFVVLHNNTIN